ncbi:hypothetical protein AYI70_g4685 [Smittium culicis]|uniref:Uncharacterized protein n=1 Tax=Smittium culicis TaxID=133412 RepID=A0A1R1XY62_9FUNG|nr:hypothetical protein AYI70_g11390 [Smittium culicis]OMJ19509.1 hypothetical protein AYI70_g4685 [Smittium culicis]
MQYQIIQQTAIPSGFNFTDSNLQINNAYNNSSNLAKKDFEGFTENNDFLSMFFYEIDRSLQSKSISMHDLADKNLIYESFEDATENLASMTLPYNIKRIVVDDTESISNYYIKVILSHAISNFY